MSNAYNKIDGLIGCSYSEFVFEGNTQCYFSAKYWRNWGHIFGPIRSYGPGLNPKINRALVSTIIILNYSDILLLDFFQC